VVNRRSFLKGLLGAAVLAAAPSRVYSFPSTLVALNLDPLASFRTGELVLQLKERIAHINGVPFEEWEFKREGFPVLTPYPQTKTTFRGRIQGTGEAVEIIDTPWQRYVMVADAPFVTPPRREEVTKVVFNDPNSVHGLFDAEPFLNRIEPRALQMKGGTSHQIFGYPAITIETPHVVVNSFAGEIS
jgi:hypothetical protein